MPAGLDRVDMCEAEFDCPSCGDRHRARVTVELRRQPIVFGGGSVGTETEAPWAGPVVCPRSNRTAECHLLVPVRDGEYVRRLTVTEVVDLPSSANPPAAAPVPQGTTDQTPATSVPAATDDWITAELAEWRRSSVSTTRTYATTMLTTSSAAVAVYFSVLKFLGYDTVPRPWGWLTIVPPVLFLVAAGSQALALHPALTYVRTEDYAAFRSRRITQMHARATAGTALFIGGLLVSVVVFFVVLT